WPYGSRWALNVRHDFDRFLSPEQVGHVLADHERVGTAGTWYWRTAHLVPRGPLTRHKTAPITGPGAPPTGPEGPAGPPPLRRLARDGTGAAGGQARRAPAAPRGRAPHGARVGGRRAGAAAPRARDPDTRPRHLGARRRRLVPLPGGAERALGGEGGARLHRD